MTDDQLRVLSLIFNTYITVKVTANRNIIFMWINTLNTNQSVINIKFSATRSEKNTIIQIINDRRIIDKSNCVLLLLLLRYIFSLKLVYIRNLSSIPRNTYIWIYILISCWLLSSLSMNMFISFLVNETSWLPAVETQGGKDSNLKESENVIDPVTGDWSVIGL